MARLIRSDCRCCANKSQLFLSSVSAGVPDISISLRQNFCSPEYNSERRQLPLLPSCRFTFLWCVPHPGTHHLSSPPLQRSARHKASPASRTSPECSSRSKFWSAQKDATEQPVWRPLSRFSIDLTHCTSAQRSWALRPPQQRYEHLTLHVRQNNSEDGTSYALKRKIFSGSLSRTKLKH